MEHISSGNANKISLNNNSQQNGSFTLLTASAPT